MSRTFDHKPFEVALYESMTKNCTCGINIPRDRTKLLKALRDCRCPAWTMAWRGSVYGSKLFGRGKIWSPLRKLGHKRNRRLAKRVFINDDGQYDINMPTNRASFKQQMDLLWTIW